MTELENIHDPNRAERGHKSVADPGSEERGGSEILGKLKEISIFFLTFSCLCLFLFKKCVFHNNLRFFYKKYSRDFRLLTSIHETLAQRWFANGPTSWTVDQL